MKFVPRVVDTSEIKKLVDQYIEGCITDSELATKLVSLHYSVEPDKESGICPNCWSLWNGHSPEELDRCRAAQNTVQCSNCGKDGDALICAECADIERE